jgi:hypothetical protein
MISPKVMYGVIVDNKWVPWATAETLPELVEVLLEYNENDIPENVEVYRIQKVTGASTAVSSLLKKRRGEEEARRERFYNAMHQVAELFEAEKLAEETLKLADPVYSEDRWIVDDITRHLATVRKELDIAVEKEWVRACLPKTR